MPLHGPGSERNTPGIITNEGTASGSGSHPRKPGKVPAGTVVVDSLSHSSSSHLLLAAAEDRALGDKDPWFDPYGYY